MRTIIAGGRNITDPALVDDAVNLSGFEVSEVVEGGQRTYDKNGKVVGGVDWLANQWGHKNRVPVKTVNAKWEEYGRSAGPRRNREMAEYAQALIAVWDGESRGTKNMIDEAKRRGLKVFVHRI